MEVTNLYWETFGEYMIARLAAATLSKDKLLYLASPFTHDSKLVMHQRYVDVLRMTTILHADGWAVYSPIVYSYNLWLVSKKPPDFNAWRFLDEEMVKAIPQFGIYMIDGWEESIGVHKEWEIAEGLNKPTVFIHN